MDVVGEAGDLVPRPVGEIGGAIPEIVRRIRCAVDAGRGRAGEGIMSAGRVGTQGVVSGRARGSGGVERLARWEARLVGHARILGGHA